MRLAASLVIRNELDRYLKPCIAHLLEFCDLVVVLDDASDDGTREYLIDHPDPTLHVVTQDRTTFYEHEGRTRQLLVDQTLAQRPTHVLSIDADEFVSDGHELRAQVEASPDEPVWALDMEEIWKASPRCLYAREDGGWRTHPLGVLWKAPTGGEQFTMMNRKLACRRVPQQVLAQGRGKSTGVSVLHFGWTDPATRRRRHARYTEHDRGRFHASTHLASVLWPEHRIRLRERPWPAGQRYAGFLREKLTGMTAINA